MKQVRRALLPYSRMRYAQWNNTRYADVTTARDAAREMLRDIAAKVQQRRVHIYEIDALGRYAQEHLYTLLPDGTLRFDAIRRANATACECRQPQYVSGGYCGACGLTPVHKNLGQRLGSGKATTRSEG